MSFRRRRPDAQRARPIAPLIDRMDEAEIAQRQAAERLSQVLAEVRNKLREVADTTTTDGNTDDGG